MYTSGEIKVISIDLDGTLFKSDGTVASETLQTLIKCKRNGMVLIFNTARPFKMIPLQLYNQFSDDYWVFSNGTTCQKNGKEIFHLTMNKKHISMIIHQLYSSHREYFFSIETGGQIFTTSTCANTNTRYFAELQTLDFILSQKINKIIIIAENRDFPLEAIEPLLHRNLKLLVTEQGKYVQIMPKVVSKLSAVINILSLLELNLSNVISFGDDLNDIELLKASKIGVAMGNADVKVKNIADYVTTSNDKNGIGLFLDELFHDHIYSKILEN